MSLCRYFPTPSDRMGILWSLLCIEDSVVLEYGPAGTTHYSISLFGGLGVDQQNRLFTTHMSEDDVVMGDVSRLERALVEVDQNYAPRVIFVVASSVSAVIGTDLRGVCAYMQEKVRARLIAFEQGGFRGDYSAGLCETYRLIAEQAVAPAQKRAENTYNLLGLSAGAYRARSDRNEIVRLMRAAFGMEMHACLCLDTDMRTVETCGAARLNLVLRGEALPAARILAETCHTPYVAGAPYGYAGTLAWLERVADALGQPIAPELVRELKEKSLQASQLRMYARMRKQHRPTATLYGEYEMVRGLAAFLEEVGLRVENRLSAHSLRALEAPDPAVRHLPVEKERIELLRGLRHQLVLADEVSHALLAPDNFFVRASMPLVHGAQTATHLPLAGPRGADALLESVEEYLETLA